MICEAPLIYGAFPPLSLFISDQMQLIPDETLSGLVDSLKTAIHTFTQSELCMVTAVTSGCELFLRFITLTALDHSVGKHLYDETLSVFSSWLGFQ